MFLFVQGASKGQEGRERCRKKLQYEHEQEQQSRLETAEQIKILTSRLGQERKLSETASTADELSLEVKECSAIAEAQAVETNSFKKYLFPWNHNSNVDDSRPVPVLGEEVFALEESPYNPVRPRRGLNSRRPRQTHLPHRTNFVIMFLKWCCCCFYFF